MKANQIYIVLKQVNPNPQLCMIPGLRMYDVLDGLLCMHLGGA